MARSPSVRVVDRRLQPGEVWASKAGTGLGASVGTHFTLLWVLAGFVVLTAIICMYAGEQRHLAERQFGDVRVHDDLRVDGKIMHVMDQVNLTATATTLVAGKQYMSAVGAPGALTLPVPNAGDYIRLVIDVQNTSDIVISTPSGVLYDTSSTLFGGLANTTVGFALLARPDGTADNTLTSDVSAEEWGIGTVIEFTGVSSTRWRVNGHLLPSGATAITADQFSPV